MRVASKRSVLLVIAASLTWGGCVFDGAALEDYACDRDADCLAFGEDLTCVGGVCQLDACADDAACDDGLFCNGEERCLPREPGADGRGCVREALVTEDGIACTEDICDEAQDMVRHVRTNACGCEVDADCAAQATSSCRVGTCEAGECTFVNRRQGSACATAGSCQTDAACDAQGQCVSTPSDAACDDGLFCNGEEVCDPAAVGADATTGCAPGAAPQPPAELDDDEPCTEARCDEEQDRFFLDASSCGCDAVGASCDDPDPDDCVEFRCGESLTCQRVNLPEAASCDDGFACTFNDACNGRGTCVGAPRDTLCDDGLFCNGEEVCEPGAGGGAATGCVGGTPAVDQWRATHPELPACVDLSCDEAVDAVTEEPGADCECLEDADCLSPCAASAVCNLGVCEVTLKPAGAGCTLSCANNPVEVSGVCEMTRCVIPPEGPTPAPTCADGFDNDCDGLVDGSDGDCAVPTQLAAAAPATAPVGFDEAAGVAVTLRPSGAGGRAVTGQSPNLYCLARPVFASLAPEDGELLASARAQGLQVEEVGDSSGLRPGERFNPNDASSPRGLQVCAGAGFVLKELPTPPENDPSMNLVINTYAVSVELGDALQGGLAAGSYLIVSYATGQATTSGFIPELVISGGQGLRDVTFVLPNTARHLRFEVVSPGGDGGGCGFIRHVKIYVTRALTPSSDAYRALSTWRLDGVSASSSLDFNNIQDPGYFARTFGLDPAAEHQGTISLLDNRALWRAHAPGDVNTARSAWITLPAAGEPPADLPLRQGAPLLFSFVAEMTADTAITAGDRAAVEVNATGAGWSPLLSFPGAGLGGAYSASVVRRVVELPEAAKTLASLLLRFSSPGIQRSTGRLGLDTLLLFSSRLEGCESAVVGMDTSTLSCLTQLERLPSSADQLEHTVRIHARLAQPHEIRCYWQAPGRPELATVASDPVFVSFQ